MPLFQTTETSHIWQDNNYPELIETEKFLLQKMEYIRYNTARKRYIEKPECRLYSSTNPGQKFIDISPIY